MQRHCGGRLVFNRDEVVIPWLQVTDENLLEYMTETCGITQIPEKLRQKLAKVETSVPQEVVTCG